jgi:hypothetical protein
MALNDVPNAGQTLANSQGQIRNNFLFINNGFELDHIEFNLGADSGKHKKLTMPVQADDAATAANELLLITKTSTLGAGGPQLYLKRPDGALNAGVKYEFTGRGASTTEGWTILPSGILLKWGSAGTQPAGLSPDFINFPTGASIPVFNQIFNLQIQQITSGNIGTNAIVRDVIEPTGFKINNTNSHAVAISWFAIGLAQQAV